MADFGNEVTTLQGVYIGALSTANQYPTVARFKYAQNFNYEPENDTDEIKSEGIGSELLSVNTFWTATLEEASLQADAMNIATGNTESISGSSGNRQAKEVAEGGGDGKPYVGVIAVFATTRGGRFVVGFPKGMLQNEPQFEAGQNEFRTGELEFKFVRAAATNRKMRKRITYEAAADVPDFTVAANWNTFFSEMFTS
jgi:hypothetical protein